MKFLQAVCLLSYSAFLLEAQPPPRPEVYVHAGWFSIAGDESTGPGALSFGGGAQIPITARFGIDIDASTMKARRDFGSDQFQIRGTFVNFSLVARWGSERTYVFAGARAGVENTNSVSRASNFLPGFRPPGAQEVAPGVFEFRNSETRPSLVVRTGLVQTITERLVARIDMLWSQRFVAPSIGVRAGLGLRF